LRLLLRKWEPDTVAYVKSRVKEGMLVVDVGAHVGYYTRLFAELVGPRGFVVALEPHPETFRLLTENVRCLAHVRPLSLAAGEKEGPATLFDALVETGSASLRLHWTKRDKQQRETRAELAPRTQQKIPLVRYSVEVRRADNILRSLDINRGVDFLKVDVEGAEVTVLRSFGEMLRDVGEVVCELGPSHLQSFATSAEELLALLRCNGFSEFGILDGGVRWASSAEIEHFAERMDVGEVVNIVARKPR
jgi:FkbM family methyltransferase